MKQWYWRTCCTCNIKVDKVLIFRIQRGSSISKHTLAKHHATSPPAPFSVPVSYHLSLFPLTSLLCLRASVVLLGIMKWSCLFQTSWLFFSFKFWCKSHLRIQFITQTGTVLRKKWSIINNCCGTIAVNWVCFRKYGHMVRLAEIDFLRSPHQKCLPSPSSPVLFSYNTLWYFMIIFYVTSQ